MSRKKGLQIKTELKVSVGWRGSIAAIVAILTKDSKRRDPSGGPMRVGRPVDEYIFEAAMRDRIFLHMVAKQDRQAAANRLWKIARGIVQGGVRPVNKPSTAARKGGDRRALRNESGADRIYENLETDPPAK